ncbi:TonB-dependent receptor [Limnovirga soli]|uniref:TonB-dependent receptor n=1 Tax=Limnovirga soli TaxID=2656915 RepID=A0A8J8JUE9_9BACT|nr:TonB-dependent receptor [Limnovirga soli]NNV56958.1 TonB-dependent receptor [Limnovirga soli]
MNVKKLVCIALLIFITGIAKSQQLQGTITNDKAAPVADAFIHVLNSNLFAFTDDLGKFVIPHLTKGSYTIIVSATGYASKQATIQVVEQHVTNIDMQLADATLQLDEVMVSAEKREASQQQVPVSISTLTAKQVQQYRLWDTKDLSAIIPNFFANNSGDYRNVSSIRGITTTSYDPAVATYVDGVNQFTLDTYIGALNDIERIEVLRGPQGTLYGRNATGGVINIITKQPTNKSTGFVEINTGNYGLQRYTGGLRIPLVKDKLFVGATATFNSRDGYYTNTFNNTGFDDQHSIAGNYYIKYLPATNWAITLNVKHQNNRNKGAFPMVNGMDEAINNPFMLSQDATATMIDNTFNTSLTISHSGSKVNFTSLSAYQQNHRYYNAPLDGDFSPADIVTVINDYGNSWNNVKAFTQELRLGSAAAKKSAFQWTAGTYFYYQHNPNKQATHFGKDAGLFGIPDTDFATINTSTGKNSGIAFFAQGNYAITKQLELIAGLRYDYENKKLNVEGAYQKDGTEAFIIRPDTAGSVHYNAVSPKIGFNYRASKNTNLFATYSRGFRTGGLTQLSSDPSQPPLYPYQPEYSNNIEAGIKNTLFKDKLRLNITLFLSRINDAQVPTLVLPDAITVTRNTGKLTSKGAELELSATPVKGFRVDYNFGYTHAAYTSLKIAQNGETANLDGKRQIFTPDLTSMLAIQYSCPIADGSPIQFVARAEWMHFGTQYFDLANTIQQSPYSVINTRFGLSSAKTDFFIWSRNIGNKKYIAYAYDFGAIHLADPQTYGVTLQYRFK